MHKATPAQQSRNGHNGGTAERLALDCGMAPPHRKTNFTPRTNAQEARRHRVNDDLAVIMFPRRQKGDGIAVLRWWAVRIPGSPSVCKPGRSALGSAALAV